VVVFETRRFRATVVDILDDIDAGECLQITADDPFVVVQLLSEGAN